MSDHSAPPPSYDEVMREEAQLLSQRNTGSQTSQQNNLPPSLSPPVPHRPSHSSNTSQTSLRPPHRPSHPSSSNHQGGSSTYHSTANQEPFGTGKPYLSSHSSHSSLPVPQSNPVNAPYRYPPGYYCGKCNNTGYKFSGRPCGRCARRFGHSFDVQPINFGRPPPNALVVQPGDPRIPGRLCGNCKGTGSIDYLIFTEICPVCNGIGKIP
ncbi:putative DNA J domain Hua1 [Schizosaccharomyces osmophilus]|uniref:DNA J domain Hua1 n=1 Tax=Schizosaccharomyces osmophilus TaxID=2545709 RepID=A0AAE9WA92_9SCHI|nr:putative DNA J domain Hua1 [Schizosaccharomyces osmophilus]WBW71532.1 putative DNA J domain Hua1 [Schizosaccharomyces osmophilus]